MNASHSASAFVLSGGGAYAAYEVGVLRALSSGVSPATDFTAVEPDVLTGTSAGSINAAVLASTAKGQMPSAVEWLERVWVDHFASHAGSCDGGIVRLRANPLDFLSPACLASIPDFYLRCVDDVLHLTGVSLRRGDEFLRSSGTTFQRFLETLDVESLVTRAKLRLVLSNVIDFSAVRRSVRAVRIAATNWRTGELRIFTNEELTAERGLNVLLASSAVPGVFPSVDIDDEPYVDGGVVMNTPLRPAIRAGASELHVVYTDPDIIRIPLPRVRSAVNTLYRFLVIGLGVTISRDIATAAAINLRIKDDPVRATTVAATGQPRQTAYRPLTIHRYFPSEDIGGPYRWLDFEPEHIVRTIQRGYEEAREHDCLANRCLIPGREADLARTETADWVRRDA